MIKKVFTTLMVLSIFFFGMHYALLHPRIAKEIMQTSLGCSYPTTNLHIINK